MNGAMLWLYRLLTGWMPESRGYAFRNALLRLAGAKIGRNVRIYSSVRILGAGSLSVGDDVHFGPEVMIYTNRDSSVTIGSHVDIAPRVTIVTGGHEVDTKGDHIAGCGTVSRIEIADGCWIGAQATLTGNIRLGEKTVVAAGSMVVGMDTDGLCLLAGVPARVKKNYG